MAEKNSKKHDGFNSMLLKKFILIMITILIINLPFFDHGFCGNIVRLTDGDGIYVRPEALWKTGPVGEGAWIVPNGRRITPFGKMVITPYTMPLGIVVDPWGPYVLTTHGGAGNDAIVCINTDTAEILDTCEVSRLFYGLKFNWDGRYLYAAGGEANKIYIFNFHQGDIEKKAEWELKGFPLGIDLSPDDDYLYVVTMINKRLTKIKTATGEIMCSIKTSEYPFGIAVHPSGNKIYVSSKKMNKVNVFANVSEKRMRKIKDIAVELHPEALVFSPDGDLLYVANVDEDSLSIIDTETDTVIKTLDLRGKGNEAYGTMPNAIAFSPNGDRVYIAHITDNKITVLSLPEGNFLGDIPTAWMPMGVAISRDGRRLFVANGKGIGSGPHSPTSTLESKGAVTIFDIPPDHELPQLTALVEENNSFPGRLFDVNETLFNKPCPLKRAGETPIKHVFIVIRENKTYDALLGNFPGGDGDPNNCLYCKNPDPKNDPIPNFRKLVEEFASGDNFYTNAENSNLGHQMLTAAIITSYNEKFRGAGLGGRIEYDLFINPITYPKKDYLWQNCLRQGISFRNYGEAVGMGKDFLIFNKKYMHWGIKDTPYYNNLTRDIEKMEERIAEWESPGFEMPQLVFMLLPNDHTVGNRFGFPTPRSMVADNDEATGRFIDWLSHSKYWQESLVIITEDDPQQGRDHIDAHRTVLLLVSPWVKRHYVSPVHYCEAHIHATVQYILGMEPMTVHDATAQPMWDMFTPESDFTPYEWIPRTLPEEFNPPGIKGSEESRYLDLVEPDQAVGLQDILWENEKELKLIELALKENEDIQRAQEEWQEAWHNFFLILESIRNQTGQEEE